MPRNQDKIMISFELPKDLIAKLDERADAYAMSRSAYLRLLIVQDAQKAEAK